MSQGSGVSVTMAGVCTSDKSDKIKLREDSDDIPGVTLFQASQFTHQEAALCCSDTRVRVYSSVQGEIKFMTAT